MSKELVIGSNRHETKVAILEDDQLAEIYFQRANEYSLAGSIHKGRVTRVLPGMQSAFVDLGLERDTFLYVSDFFEENEDFDPLVEDKPVRNDRRERGPVRSEPRPIERVQFAPVVQAPAPVTVQAPAPAPAVVEPEELDEPEDLVSEAGPAVTGGEARVVEGAESGDRGAFRGDKRGRRSRRRRSRGRGFPENKYAQASDVQAEERPAETERTPEPVFGAGVNPSAEPEVIQLPGESLAKYRRADSSAGKVVQSAPVVSTSLPSIPLASSPLTSNPLASGSFGSESGPAHQEVGEEAGNALPQDLAEEDLEPEDLSPEELDEELEAEAEELALSDAVFAHNDELTVEDEEAKIEEVREDKPASDEPLAEQPISDFSVQDIETEEGLEDEDSASPEALDEPGAEAPPKSFGLLEITSSYAVEALPEGASLQDVFPDEDSEVAAARAYLTSGMAAFEDERVTAFLEIEEFRSEEAEFLGASPEILTTRELITQELVTEERGGHEGLLGSPEAPVEGQSQSASVREEGGRFLHRTSRRMRRRRGGNRFQGQEQTGNEAPEPAVARGGGVAAAMEPVARETQPEPDEERTVERPERVMPSIADLLKAGQEIIVQIAKEPLGQKGARITSHVALPGRYVVFMPSVGHLGVSRKIESDEERQRLKKILQAHRVGTTGGFIVRTAGEGVPEDEIAADMDFLYKLWLDIRGKAEKRPAPALLHYDLDIVQRILRDQVTEEFKAIWVDNEDMYENVLNFMQRFQPAFVNRVKMYTRSAPIFDAFNITQELERALRPKVWLKSGGYIVINQTEALVAIDINTGKYVGKSNRLEDTIVKTNVEAVKEIVRQIRLRDLGGIIVVDFIDMDERKNRQRVMQALEEAMQVDRAPYKILQFNDFGLVAITRKRVKQSLERTLCSPCPACEGAGYVKSVSTVISEILVEALKIAKAIQGKDVVLRVHPEVAKVLKASSNRYLEELEETLGRPVLVTGDPTLLSDKFDLA